MKKVLQVVNYMFPHIGGIEVVAHDIMKSIDEQFEQKIICFNDCKDTVVDKIEDVEVNRIGVNLKVASQSISFKYGKKLRKLFKSFSPDIVIFHYPNPFAAHYLLRMLRNKNIKFILFWHSDIIKQKVFGKLFYGQNKRLLKRANRIIATSPNYIENSVWLKKYKEKCEVISCCIDESRLAITEENVEMSNNIRSLYFGKKVCFAFGRHVEYKGFEYLVKASKYLSDDYVILLGGSGPLTDELKKMAKSDNKIVFLGKLSDSDLKSYLMSCDIFCFPSITKNEAFGIALAEAMYFEKPAVTFTIDGSGVNYLSIDGLTGVEVKKHDPKDYAKALMKDIPSQYGINAKQRIMDLFTFKIFKEKINELLNKM